MLLLVSFCGGTSEDVVVLHPPPPPQTKKKKKKKNLSFAWCSIWLRGLTGVLRIKGATSISTYIDEN